MRLLKTALAFTFLGVVGSAFAADNFRAVRAGLPHDAIYSIDRSGGYLWAIGGHGLILRSDNDGADWERIASPGDFAALGMAIHKGQPVIS